MRISRTGAVVAAAALLLATGCGSDDDKKKDEASGPQTYTIETDMNRADLNLPVSEFALAYYP
jgi:hypothetical protein